MNADIIFIEGAGSVAESAAVKAVSDAIRKRGIKPPVPLAATSETLDEVFNAALARSNVIIIVGGIGADAEDNAVRTVADVLSEECEMNFSALGRIASSYARSGEEMPESAANAALVIRGSTVIPNTVGAAVGCAVSSGSQYIMLIAGTAAEANVMLETNAGVFLDNAVFTLAKDSGETLEYMGEDDEVDNDEHITFNPSAITSDMPADEGELTIADQATDIILSETDADDEPIINPLDEPEALGDLSATVVFDAGSEIADEIIPESEAELIAEPETYVVLTPSKETNTEIADEASDEEFVELKDAATEPEMPAKKAPFIIRVLRYLLPWKGDVFVDILRKFIFAAAIVGLIVSSCYIGDFFLKMADNNQVIEQARELYHPENNEVNPETGVYNRFDELIAQNADCVGWITVPNTKIDNPVYKTTDNDYYLTNNSLKEPSVYGAIFADYRDGITVRGNSKNVTLYGHHMKDGSMFANLHKYKKMSFYKENPVVTFDTKYGTGGQYKVFACMITNSDPMDDNGYFFDFAAPNFRSDEDFMNWVEQVRRRSLYDTPVDVVATDEILTLSTCTYEVKESNLLCVVVARKVRDGETAAVNTINTSANSRIIYPAVWYETFGTQKPTYADGIYTWVSGDYNREDINAPTDTSSLPSDSDESVESVDSSESTSSEAASEATSSEATSTETPSEPESSETPAESSETPVESSEPESEAPESSEPPVESSEPESEAPESSEPPVESSEAPESSEPEQGGE